MSSRASAVRYARALFDVARAEADPAAVERDLDSMVAAIAGSDELAAIVSRRAVPDDVRRRVLAAVADRLQVAPPVGRLLALLAERRRLSLLPDIARAYTERHRQYRNVIEAEVRTAAPLSAEAEAALRSSLSAATGKQVSMRVVVDLSLLGGIVAQVGGTVYDGSVRTQLNKMRDRLVAQG